MKITNLNKTIIIFFTFLLIFFCFPINTFADATTDATLTAIGIAFPGFTIVAKAASIVAPTAACLLSDPIGCISDAILQSVTTMAEQLSKIFLDLATTTLKTATDPNLLKLGFTPSDNAYVAIGWGIVRNLANAALVIGLVIIAISIILGKEENKAKKTLINFIIIALLINFTPVICGFIIDGSNILTSSLSTGGIDNSYSGAISNSFTLIANDKSLPIEAQFAKVIVLFIFSLFAIVIFFLYAILFFARIVILQILVIISPIAFATKVFPQSKYIRKVFPSVLYWDDWWESFVQWCVIGIPAGMSIYLSNKMMVSFTTVAGTSTDPLSALITYIIPFIFLIAGFLITISAGGQVGSFVGGMATGAWAMSGGRITKGLSDRAKAGGEWAGERIGAAGTKIQEGAVGMAGVMAMDKTNQPRDLSMFNKEDREAGRQAWSGWKKRAVQETPLKYLTTPPALGKDKDAALDNYGKNWNRYSTADRDKMEKMLVDKDPSAFLKGGIDKDKNAAENSREYQRRLAAVANHGGDKAKFEGYLHASGNTQYMGTGGLATVNKWAADNKLDDVGKKIRSMSAKDARDKIGADAIKQNPDILKNMGSKMTVSIMQQGSEEQRSAMKEMTTGRNNADFSRYLTDQRAIKHNPASSVDEKEQARVNIERGLKVLNEVVKNS